MLIPLLVAFLIGVLVDPRMLADAMHVLPILALGSSRRRFTPDTRARIVVTGSVVYLGLFVMLLVQAQSGTPLVAR